MAAPPIYGPRGPAHEARVAQYRNEINSPEYRAALTLENAIDLGPNTQQLVTSLFTLFRFSSAEDGQIIETIESVYYTGGDNNRDELELEAFSDFVRRNANDIFDALSKRLDRERILYGRSGPYQSPPRRPVDPLQVQLNAIVKRQDTNALAALVNSYSGYSALLNAFSNGEWDRATYSLTTVALDTLLPSASE